MKARVISFESNEKIYVVFGTRRTYWTNFELAERYRKVLCENGFEATLGSTYVGNEALIETAMRARERDWSVDNEHSPLNHDEDETSTSEDIGYRTSSSTERTSASSTSTEEL